MLNGFLVVICLKNRTFAVSQTAALWIRRARPCCDLLEKSYFCSITNSCRKGGARSGRVVICLKNRTFAVSQTALDKFLGRCYGLWFAWKIVLLQYHKQQLLKIMKGKTVVICLKNRTFAVSQTAVGQRCKTHIALWFAWKIVLLQYHKQLIGVEFDEEFRCDLLEKSYFCSITNSSTLQESYCIAVVICLKNRTFAVSQTAVEVANDANVSCDLLEKSYFCSITNSVAQDLYKGVKVVICLKNPTFAVSQTAFHHGGLELGELWFAWKIVLLQYHKQRRATALARTIVVICLKNRTFAVSQTANIYAIYPN